MNDSRKKMLEKVRAILAKTMANGCTEGEAMAAMVKARELMAAHDITESELQPETERADILRTGRADSYEIKRFLSVNVAKFTRCKTWLSRVDGITFCGLESDVAFASWLLDTLQAFVLRQLKAHQAARRAQGLTSSRHVSASFVFGCTKRINERLAELIPAEPIGTGLVVSRNALITEAMAAAGILLRDARSRGRRINSAAFGAGQAAGNGATFGRPVSSGGPLRLT